MAKSIIENAVIDFKIQLSQLKDITGLSDKGLADLIGCSEKTISRMRTDPMSVSSRYILTVQGYLKKKERERWN